MDVGNVADPQLDGDFLTLIEARQRRNNIPNDDEVAAHLLRYNEIDTGNDDSWVPGSLDITDKKVTATLMKVDVNLLRTQLFDAVANNDIRLLKSACKNVNKAGLSLTDQVFRDPQNNCTVLYSAIIQNKWEVGKFLIQSSQDEKLLHDALKPRDNFSTLEKTCLHILAENGQHNLAKMMLDQLTSTARRNVLLNAVVLTQVEGLRARNMASIHLASFNGHTNFVKLLLDSGVEVNCTNDKNDTPVLWATRGNRLDTVRFLISRGAKLHMQNDRESTPLYWAVRYGFVELVRLLVAEGGANVHHRRDRGFATPIVLASALGHRDIVEILLDYEADVETHIGNGTTALHLAAQEGYPDVVELLVTKGRALVNQTDTAGNTALLCAAKVGNVAMMNQLVLYGASIDAQNKLGETIWHYAILHDDDTLLKIFVGLYRKTKQQQTGSTILKFASGHNPLQVAVAADSVDKVRCLLQLGVDIKATDLNGNTFYHMAARGGKAAIIQAFIDEVDLTSVNDDGDTPLHLAAKTEHVDIVNLLLKKSKLDARNKSGLNSLQAAVGSENASPEVIKSIIEVIVNTHNWSLVNATDSTGCTPLHIVARRGRPDILAEMAALNIAARNDDGDTPFHLSARGGHPYSMETMIQVFNIPGKGSSVDEKTKDGQSALHICAARGDWQRVELLVSVGADLSLQDNKGNTPLHIVVEESTKTQSKMESFLEVLRVVVKCAARWWSTRHGRQVPTDESELYYAEMRAAMIHLTSDVRNDDGLNVIAMATVNGSIPLIQEMLNTPNVYKFQKHDAIVYDVTYLTPRTKSLHKLKQSLPTCRSNELEHQNKNKRNSTTSLLDGAPVVSKYAAHATHVVFPTAAATVTDLVNESCLELVASMPDEVLAARVLDVEPYRQLVRNKWSHYQSIYVFLMLVHVTYMSLYSVYAVPSSDRLHAVYNDTSKNDTTGTCASFTDSPHIFGLFLIWPISILIFTIFQIVSNLVRCLLKSRCCSPSATASTYLPSTACSQFFMLPFHLFRHFVDYLEELSAISFGALTIAWYVLYRCGTTSQTYVQVSALVFIVGWMFTLNYTKGFEEMHSFTAMLKWIIVLDITRFVLLFLCVLLGFGMAFHALFQLSPTIAAEHGSAGTTLFTVFNLMLGLGSPFDANFGSIYSADGGNPTFVYWVYIIYIAISSIILINLLVAMMNDSYSSIKANEGSTWKVNSLQLALRFERTMPLLLKLFRGTIGHDPITYDEKAGRWMLSVPSYTVLSLSNEPPISKDESIEILKTVQRLEAKIDRIQVTHSELAKQVDLVTGTLHGGVEPTKEQGITSPKVLKPLVKS